MSYDTYIKIDTGGEWPAVVEECGNYTCNVGQMFRAAMPGPYPGGGKYNGTLDPEPCGGLCGISGLGCREAKEILRSGVKYMEDHRAEMTKLNPPNGWGEYERALGYLRTILDACIKHPNGFVAVNW